MASGGALRPPVAAAAAPRCGARRAARLLPAAAVPSLARLGMQQRRQQRHVCQPRWPQRTRQLCPQSAAANSDAATEPTSSSAVEAASSSGGGFAESTSSGTADNATPQVQQQQQGWGGEQPQQEAAAAAAVPGVELRSFDLKLPESSSGVTGLDALDETELAQQAQDWGFTQLGRPFPEAISPVALADTLRPALFQPSFKKAAAGLALAAALIFAGCWWQAYMHSICPLWQRLLCWLAVGTGYFGAFQAAADCARFAYWPQEPLAQDALGAALMAPALIPFEGWRLQQFNHMLRPNMLNEDSPLWHPLTTDDVAALPPPARAATALLHATPLRFFARGLAGWAAAWDGLDLRRHPQAARARLLLSWAVPAAFVAVGLPALLATGGVERLVGWWLGPWVVFLSWQGLFAVASHTAPHIPYVEEGYEYDAGQAIVNGTVALSLPPWLETAVGAANHALPRLLSMSIPHYHLAAAQAELNAKLGPYLTAARLLDPTLLLNLSTRWLVWDPERRRYVQWGDAAAAAAERGEGAEGVVAAA